MSITLRVRALIGVSEIPDKIIAVRDACNAAGMEASVTDKTTMVGALSIVWKKHACKLVGTP